MVTTLTNSDIDAVANAVMRKELRTFRILLKVCRPELEKEVAKTLDRYAAKEIETLGGDLRLF